MEVRKDRSRSLDSFLVSIVVHILVVIFLASYVTIGRRPHLPGSVAVTWVKVPEPELSMQKPLLDQSLVRKSDPKRDAGRSPKVMKELKSSDLAQTVAPSPEIIRRSVELNRDAIQAKILPSVMTEAEVGPSAEAPFSVPVTTASGAEVGKGAVTGRTRAGGTDGKRGLSIVTQNTAEEAGVALDKLKSPTSLREDELGGVLIGQGNDISGHIRLIRVRHRLSDWWQDPSALTGLIDWLNKNTRIHADMKVAGGVLSLDEREIFDAPVLIMTGHDRAVTMSHNLTQPERSGGKLGDSLTSAEKAGLREYLLDRGGLLFFDDCGFHGLFADEVKALLREVLPEYNLERIPKTHKLFNCYYELNGPPRGSEMFWGSENLGRGVVFPFIQGISIGTRLAVIFSKKDYLCAIETVEIPSHTQLRYRYSPEVYKFMTNVVVYSMRYGGITDRSDYN